ncbi:phosphoglucosamine mutase [Nitrosopumilus sp.]|uniref:phosphoglucosamine mutase n=1 Tax=Nitrosopumilus sp. TaxID=2024843 RepID=UPI003B5C17E4
MAKFFGTNGIRGVFGESLTLEFIHDMTLSIGTYFQKGPILVGFDGRNSSPIICRIVTSTLNSIGIDCNIAGIVPTPCLEFAVKKLGYIGGMMITASHNPPQYNGIKPAGKDGVEISRDDELIIEKIYEEKNWIKNPVRWGETGNEEKTIQTYLEGVVSQINSEKIKSREIKVVLDLGNGTQAVAAPDLCKMLNCKTLLVNSTIDGNFPGRGSEPIPENLSLLSKTILQNNADVGIAFDGDGDRSIFCDNKGNILTGDKSALLLARHILKDNPGSLVVTCLNSGNAIEELTSQFKSEVIRTKVGSVEVSRKMIPTKALIGFEENGGFMYGKHNQVRDGCMTLALMLEMLSNSEKTLSEEISTLPPSFTTKDKIPCLPEQTRNLISVLSKEFPTSDTTDGIKIMISPEKWVMIRPSGTEPIIRIYAEAKSKEELDGLMSEYLEKIKSIISR